MTIKWICSMNRHVVDVALYSGCVCVIASYDSCRDDGEGDLPTNFVHCIYNSCTWVPTS